MPDLSHLSPPIPGKAPHLSHLSYTGEVVGGGDGRPSSPDTTDPVIASLSAPVGRAMCGDAAHARWATAHTAQTPPATPDPLAVGIAGGITGASQRPRASILSTNGGRSWADVMSPLGARRWSR